MKRFLDVSLPIAALTVAAIFTILQPADAAHFFWDGGGAPGGAVTWSTDANWGGDIQPPNDGTADVSMAGSIDTTNTVDYNADLKSLSFSSSLASFTISGNQLLIRDFIENQGALDHRINNPLVMGNASTIIGGYDGARTYLGGPVAIGSVEATLAGVTVENVLSGAGKLRITADALSPVVLTGADKNTYTGVTHVRFNALVLSKSPITAANGAVPGPLVLGDETLDFAPTTVRLEADHQLGDGDEMFFTGAGVTINKGGLLDLNGHIDFIPLLTLAGGAVETGAGLLGILGTSEVTSIASDQTASISGRLQLDNSNRDIVVGSGLGFAVPGQFVQPDLDISASISGGGITKKGPGVLQLSGSEANVYSGPTTVNEGTLVLAKSSGAPTAAIPGALVIGDGQGVDRVMLAGNQQSLASGAISINSSGVLDLNAFSTIVHGLTLTGGAVTTGSTFIGFGTLGFYTGEIKSMASGKTATISGKLGSTSGNELTFSTEKGTTFSGVDLDVSAEVTTLSSLIKSGAGTLRLSGQVSGQDLIVEQGRVLVAGDIQTSLPSRVDAGATLEFEAGGTFVSGQGLMPELTNWGLVRGEGRLLSPITNLGEVRVEPGRRLRLDGAHNNNWARITLQNGILEFAHSLRNAQGSEIVGHGTLIGGSAGLINNGRIAFLGGSSDVFGAVNNSDEPAGGVITVAGGGDVTFWGDVVNPWGVIDVKSGSAVTFMGDYEGKGIAGNADDIHFESELRLGSLTPPTMEIAGNVSLGSHARLALHLGGPIDSMHDKVQVDGNLSLDGTLAVSLGFAPIANMTFDLLDWTTLAGTFSALQLPALPTNLSWNATQLYTNGTLSIGWSADFDRSGQVNGVDLAYWRNGYGASSGAAQSGGDADGDHDVDGRDFLAWQRQFGAGSPTTSASLPVPEPAAWMLLGAAGAAASTAGRRVRRCSGL